MAGSVWPSVLAATRRQFLMRLRRAETIGQRIHLDVMDGRFVPTRSIGPTTLAGLLINRPHEIHLMVTDPAAWLSTLLRLGTKTAIVPVEIGASLRMTLALLRSHRIAVALSISPTTPLGRLRAWARYVRRFHVMTVRPGRYGAPFLPGMVRRVKRLHARYPRHVVSCDGGMNERTIPLVRRAGASIIIVGSRLVEHPRPLEEWHRLRALL